MPIVKFISDKDCQLFIDKEYVGRITNDSMLKQTLEPGGYLVEVKDEDALVLKKYNLEIKATDSHVLQDLSIGKETIDDVINQLRNDSSLVFHCNRAPFCFNGLYGYINKRFEVVIPAIYTIANKFKDDKAFVVREFPEGNKTTLIDEDGNMFFNRWFDYIGETEETILLGIDNRIIVYSKIKYDKTAEYYYTGYDHKVSLVPVYKKVGDYNFYGYVDYDGKEVIPFIFNNASNFDDKGEAKVNFMGKGVIICNDGYCQRVEEGFYDWMKWDENPIGLEGILEEDQDPRPWQYSTGDMDWDFIPIWNNYKWVIRISINEVGPRKEIKRRDFNCDYVLRLEKGYVICKQAAKVLVLIANIYNNDVEDFLFDADDVVPVFDINHNLQGDDIITSRTFIIKRNNKYGVFNTLGEELIPVEYDEIIPFEPYVFAVRKSSKYGLYIDGKLSTIKYDSISSLSFSRGYLLEKDGKYGLRTSWNFLPPVYDNIDNRGDRNIVCIDNKYGIIDNEGKEILPIKFDKILPINNYNFKAKISNGWSLGELYHGNINSGVYDNITLLSQNNKETWFNDVLSVRKEGKYGCISNNGEILIPIEYNKIELNSTFYYPRRFSLILYKGKKVGFCEFSFDDGYRYIVKPSFDSCVLLENKGSVLTNYGMHYAAVQKDGKWGILDQKPRKYTYFAIEINLRTLNKSNLKDLVFKYDSVEELMEDADNEFQRRYKHYYCPWIQMRDENGEYCIFKEDDFMV